MASFNRVILVGNVTRDLEIRYTQSGMAVLDLGMAVNDRRKNQQGEWIEETTFVDVTLWGRTAEVAAEYLSKGAPVLIEGRLKLDRWETNDGQKRSKLSVVGERMQLLGNRGQGGGGGGGQGGGGYQRQGGGGGGGHQQGGGGQQQGGGGYQQPQQQQQGGFPPPPPQQGGGQQAPQQDGGQQTPQQGGQSSFDYTPAEDYNQAPPENEGGNPEIPF